VCFSTETLLGKHVPLATVGLPAGCTLCEIIQKNVAQGGVVLSVILVAFDCMHWFPKAKS